jgi:hypothetical protein
MKFMRISSSERVATERCSDDVPIVEGFRRWGHRRYIVRNVLRTFCK